MGAARLNSINPYTKTTKVIDSELHSFVKVFLDLLAVKTVCVTIIKRMSLEIGKKRYFLNF